MRRAHKFPVIFLFIFSLLCCGAAHSQDSGGVPDEQAPLPGDNVTVSTIQFDTFPARSVEVRAIPDTTLRRVRSDDAYWYANLSPERAAKPKPKPSSGANLGRTAESLIWILIIACFVGALIWYLASSDIGLFRRSSPPLEVAEEDPLSEDIFALDYDSATGKAIASGNYRLAIRLLYLDLLRNLADRNIIAYKQERTNSEYLSQLSGTAYHRPFFRLTRDFEYSWYGQFRITPEAFAQVQKEFADFKRLLPS